MYNEKGKTGNIMEEIASPNTRALLGFPALGLQNTILDLSRRYFEQQLLCERRCMQAWGRKAARAETRTGTASHCCCFHLYCDKEPAVYGTCSVYDARKPPHVFHRQYPAFRNYIMPQNFRPLPLMSDLPSSAHHLFQRSAVNCGDPWR